MNKIILILLTAVLLTSLTACSPREAEAMSSASISSIPAPEVSDEELTELSAGNTSFAFSLYHALTEREDNLFFSPYSISAALAMTYAGAEGDTETEMADVLEFSLSDELLHPTFNLLDRNLAAASEADSTFSLHIVNALWGQDGFDFLPEFLEIIAANYEAGISFLDFSKDPELCRETINEWIAGQTREKIIDLIPENVLTTATKLVLTNAIYFKAQWFFQFEETATLDQPFNLLDGEQVMVPTMHQSEHFQTGRGDGYMAVELPYTSRRMSMLIIMPDQDRFPEIEESLGNNFVNEISRSMRNVNLYLSMPKFETVSEFRLEEVLAVMGMPSAFGISADFSDINRSGSLYISSVIHKAFVCVDENGTEAAAATAVVMDKLNGDSTTDFIIDRPFIYLIMDRETGTVLFIGRVLNPLE